MRTQKSAEAKNEKAACACLLLVAGGWFEALTEHVSVKVSNNSTGISI